MTALALRRFEKQLLQELGYGLNLEHDNQGEPIQSGRRYDYRIGQGACRPQGRAVGVEIAGATLLALRDDHLDEAQSRGEARQLLRAALYIHLGPKPLQTPELFRDLRRLKGGAPSASGTAS
jgi:DNA repair protein RecO (recombination protein O)